MFKIKQRNEAPKKEQKHLYFSLHANSEANLNPLEYFIDQGRIPNFPQVRKGDSPCRYCSLEH